MKLKRGSVEVLVGQRLDVSGAPPGLSLKPLVSHLSARRSPSEMQVQRWGQEIGCSISGEARMKKLVLPFWNERKTHKKGSQKFS